MSFRGWFGERYRHSLAARGVSLAIKKLPSTVRYPDIYYPQLSQAAQPFVRKQILGETLEDMNRRIEAEKAFEQITGERMAPGTLLESVPAGNYLSQYDPSNVEQQIYPLYGTIDQPSVPYWYGQTQFMSAEDSLQRYNDLKAELADRLYNESLKYPENSILSSNMISMDQKRRILAKLREESIVNADIMLKKELGLSDDIDVMAYPMTQMMKREEYLKPYKITGEDLSPGYDPMERKPTFDDRFVSYEGFGLPEQGYKMYKKISTSGESIDKMPYIQPFTGTNVRGNLQSYNTRQKQWAGYLNSLRAEGLDVPMGLKNVNDLANWYFDKYSGSRLSKGQFVSEKGVLDDIKRSARDYLDSVEMKSPRKTKVVSSKGVTAKVPLATDETIKKVELSGQALFNTEDTAKAFVNQMKKYGVLYDYEQMNGKFKVYKPKELR